VLDVLSPNAQLYAVAPVDVLVNLQVSPVQL
jgi:hypothetical protein